MPVPFSTAKVTAFDATPVQLLTWQRTDKAFSVYVRNDSGSGRLHVTGSASGTSDTSYTIEPGNEMTFNVPAGPAYGSSPVESLYVFADPERPVTASAFIGPH